MYWVEILGGDRIAGPFQIEHDAVLAAQPYRCPGRALVIRWWEGEPFDPACILDSWPADPIQRMALRMLVASGDAVVVAQPEGFLLVYAV